MKRLLLTLFLVLSMASTAVARPCTDADVLVEGESAPCSGHAVSEGTIEQYRVTVETLAKTKTAFELAQTAWDIKRQGLEDSLAETEATLRKTQALVLEPMPCTDDSGPSWSTMVLSVVAVAAVAYIAGKEL